MTDISKDTYKWTKEDTNFKNSQRLLEYIYDINNGIFSHLYRKYSNRNYLVLTRNNNIEILFSMMYPEWNQYKSILS